MKGLESDAFEKTQSVFEAYQITKKKYPNLTVRVIPVGLKSLVFDIEETKNIYENTLKMHQAIKDGDDDFVVGIDLVNEEDTSRSIIEFKDLIKSTLKKAPNLNLDLHAGESISSSNNEIEVALMLGTKRIGHGLNL